MSLLRLAQTNNAATNTSSPRTPRSSESSSSHSSPRLASPSTPRNRISIGVYRSPASTPSISSSLPFDWDAIRSGKPAPYGPPIQRKGRQSMGVGTPAKRVVRQKSVVERITSIPSTIAFELALFPRNVPLPTPTTSGRLVGGVLNFLHLCVRISQTHKVPDSDLGWEDMYREGDDGSWFDWTTPVSAVLIAVAFLNVVYLFTRIKVYRLHQRADPVSSPNARFVSAQLDFEPLELPSLVSRIRRGMWYGFSYSWRWLLGMTLPKGGGGQAGGKTARVQQLEVWAPGQMEMLHGMMYWYSTLIKDKEIIAAEVMNEYNQGFVYPRVMPIRKDVAVMTHEAEIVNVWEEILAENTTRRKLLTQVEADIANHRLLTSRPNYATVPDDGKSNLENDLALLERKRDDIKKQREDAINQLIKADSWPPLPLTDAEDGELGKYTEILKNVAELKEQVASINSTFAKLRKGDEDEVLMDVNPQEDPSSRPLKRRRGPESAPSLEPEPGPTTNELEEMCEKLSDLESVFATVLNELNAQDSDIRTDVQSQIDTFLEEFTDQLDSRPPLGEEVYKEVKENIDSTGKDVGELAVEVSHLVISANTQQLEMESIKEHIAASKAEYAEVRLNYADPYHPSDRIQMQKQFQSYQESRERDRKTIAALEQALHTYKTSAPPPPPPPVLAITHAHLIELIEEPLLDTVRGHIQPLIEQLRQQVQLMLNTQNAEMVKTVWGKLGLTLRMVEAISKRLERLDQTATPTAAAAAASITLGSTISG
ncbi:hypothetical protein C0991_003838 [Blastosporella zonata]|nr:hypothetical protein C0991_003838 [Blastosporella zonata]